MPLTPDIHAAARLAYLEAALLHPSAKLTPEIIREHAAELGFPAEDIRFLAEFLPPEDPALADRAQRQELVQRFRIVRDQLVFGEAVDADVLEDFVETAFVETACPQPVN